MEKERIGIPDSLFSVANRCSIGGFAGITIDSLLRL